jgi:heat shock protein HslJ
VKASQAAKPAVFSLTGSEWLLEDLGGSGVIDNAQATLSFPEAGKVAGRGSCNRFFGPAQVSGDAVKMGPLGSTRMACVEAVMNQETKYLNALQAAERFEWKDPYLLIYCKGLEKPLRFTRMTAEKPAAH